MKRYSSFIWTAMFTATFVACKPKTQGAVMLEIQTDMSMPKDIQVIDVSVTSTRTDLNFTRELKDLKHEFERLDGIRIPATFAIETTATEPAPIHIRLVAYADEAKKKPLVLVEADTTVPIDRIVRLPLSLDLLCNDSAALVEKEGDLGIFEVKYADEKCQQAGFTCLAGTCQPAKVESNDLESYNSADTFGRDTGDGNGSCFNTAECFLNAQPVELLDSGPVGNGVEPPPCIGVPQGNFDPTRDNNIGLRTTGAGMCNKQGCFVALNNGSKVGWRLDPNKNKQIVLPPGVCRKVAEGKIGGVVWKQASLPHCEMKVDSLPTCGPWSPSGPPSTKTTDPTKPIAVASGQMNPVSLALTDESIYWITRGKQIDSATTDGKGRVNWTRKDGGVPIEIAALQPIPTSIAVHASSVFDFVFWTNRRSELDPWFGSLRWASFDRRTWTAPLGTDGADVLTNLQWPMGVAIIRQAPPDDSFLSVYFTEMLNSQAKVVEVQEDANAGTLSTLPNEKPQVLPTSMFGTATLGIAVLDTTVPTSCWTYEGTKDDGVIACSFNNKTEALKLPVQMSRDKAPRDIVLCQDASGPKTRVFWLNSNVEDGVRSATLASGSSGSIFPVAKIGSPAGLAVDPDCKQLYIASRESNSIVRIAIADIAAGQLASPSEVIGALPNLGAVAVDKTHLYWIEKGSNNTATGSILKMPLP